ncbi:MAG: AraC family transcriptional regulator [Porticoccaceae bacterium]|nr:helix-turn-helix transcriptional regulator [Pseudomonadales bacterium]MCP5172938.1 helix-turn-helix transcriptional regulator [Pseudomonadales bacterium]MCP5302411.1 helix-turn-helix transcriptional regulator [Pseudomonadales bacterium]
MIVSSVPAVEAFGQACKMEPSIVRNSKLRKGVALYGWNTAGNPGEVHIPEMRELVLLVHLSGSRNVHLLTKNSSRKYSSKPGDITLIPREQGIRLHTHSVMEFVTVVFPPDAPPPREPGPWFRLLGLPDHIFAHRDDYVFATVKTLIRAIEEPPSDEFRYFSQLFDSLIFQLARIADESPSRQLRVAPRTRHRTKAIDFDALLNFIEVHLAEKLSLKELATQTKVSRSLFAREFTAKLGVSPHQFILQRRIARAMDLLLQAKLSVTEIAYEVGFSNQSHFSATFKTLTGFAPTEYATNSG